MATYRKRGKKIYAEVRIKGHPPIGKTHPNRTAARLWAEELEEQLRAGTSDPGRGKTLRDALTRYSEEVSSRKAGAAWEQRRIALLKRLLPFVDKPVAELGSDSIGRWRDARLEEVSVGSVRRELTVLGSVLETSRREWKWIRENPVRDVRRPPQSSAREQIILPEQAELLFEVAGYRRGVAPANKTQLVFAAFDFALETAMRAGEIRHLRGEDIHLADRYVRLPTPEEGKARREGEEDRRTKTGRSRDVPLSQGAVEILESLDTERPFPLSAADLDALFRKVRDRAGLKTAFRFHDTRATAITRLAKKLDIHDLARMTGHSDLRQLMGYYRATASDIAKRLD